MTDQDLEERLRRHFAAIDPVAAPPGLASRIDRVLDREAGANPRSLGLRRPALALLAAAAVVAIALAIRFGGLSAPVGTSPSPTVQVTVSPPPASATPAPSGSDVAVEPPGTFPPVTTSTWTGLDVQRLPAGPLSLGQVITWSGGYFALGVPDGSSPARALASKDGRSWISLPTAGTAGQAAVVLAAPCSNGVVVGVLDADGNSSVAFSTDGRKWTSSQAPQLRLSRAGDLVGGATGAVAVLAAKPYGLAFTHDCLTWTTVRLPNGTGTSVNSAAPFGSGFVAVGDPASSTGSPVAWSSSDGVNWAAAQVQARAGDGFRDIWAGANGLVAESTQPGYVPGLTSFWTSGDGTTWNISSADPLGIQTEGEGSGSANGLFTGDGTRLLAHGVRSSSAPYEYWISLDGTNWGQLSLTGDTSTVATGQIFPFLMRDGVLWSGDQGAWFGTATP